MVPQWRWFALEILALHPASLDARTRARIEDELFAAWLAERRAGARIQWHWGGRPDAEAE